MAVRIRVSEEKGKLWVKGSQGERGKSGKRREKNRKEKNMKCL